MYYTNILCIDYSETSLIHSSDIQFPHLLQKILCNEPALILLYTILLLPHLSSFFVCPQCHPEGMCADKRGLTVQWNLIVHCILHVQYVTGLTSECMYCIYCMCIRITGLAVDLSVCTSYTVHMYIAGLTVRHSLVLGVNRVLPLLVVALTEKVVGVLREGHLLSSLQIRVAAHALKTVYMKQLVKEMSKGKFRIINLLMSISLSRYKFHGLCPP